ncbi:MAG: hypothetical protein K9J13_11720 [Saprospiraceae bacterium]|nr:hypothetical protein [Saprospiraceae bacterium]
MNNLTKTAVFIIFFIVSQTAYTQTIITQDGKYGLIDKNKTIIIKPQLDSIYITAPDFGMSGKGAKNYILKLGDKYGYALNTIDKGWIISEIEFDMIKHKSIGFITVRKGDKYGFVAFFIRNGSNISGFHSLAWVESIEKVYISEIIYDNLDKYINGDSEYLLKDNKYCLYIGLKSLIPPIYDSVPELINYYYNNGNKDSLFFLYDVTKNGYHGVMFASYKNTKLVLPIIYKKGELFDVKENDIVKFIINQKGKPIKVFNSLDSTFLTLHSNGQPLLSTGTGKYVDTRIYYCNILSKLTNRYDSVISRNAIYHFTLNDSSKFLTENKKYLESSVSYQIILYDDITGEAIEYCKPNCRYQTGENFIVEYDIGTPQDSITKIYFYTPFEKRKICSFTLNDSYKFFEWDYTRDGNHTKIRLYRKTNNKYRYKTLGYIKNSTLTYKRRIPFVEFANWVNWSIYGGAR